MNAHFLNKSALRLLAGVSALPFVALAAQAQEVQTLPETVVTATRIPTPADQVGSSFTVITADEIERKQATTAPDVLADVPGLNLVRNGGMGGVSSIFIRGANNNHTKVLIDGIDAADPTQSSGAFDFGHIAVTEIERIEVLRGPQSGLYGSDAVGGVINIITKSGRGPLQLKGSVEGGSFATFNQSGSLSGSSGPFDYTFNVTHLREGATPVTPDASLPAGQRRNDDTYDNKTISTKLGFTATENLDFGIVARYVDTNIKFTADDPLLFPQVPGVNRSESTTNQLFTRGTAHLSLWDGRFDQTVGAAYTIYHHSDFLFNSGTTNAHGDRRKFDWQGNLTLVPGQVLTLGAEHAKENLVQAPTDASMTTNSGYLQLQSKFWDKLFTTASARLDENSRFGGAVTYRFAPAWHVNDMGTVLKGSVGTGFKTASLNEMFVNFPAFGFFGNPLLKPEESFGYDFGFDQPFLNGKVETGATWFHNDIKNLINFNSTFTTKINIGQAKTYGAETYVAWKPLKDLKFRVDYTYTVAVDATNGAQLLRRPRHKASLDSSWQATDKLRLSGTVLYVGDRIDGNRDFSVQRLTAPSYTLVNLAASYDLGHGVTAFGRIDNMFDKRYEDPTGFQRPGIGVYAGFKVAFDTGLGGPTKK